jgi:hypothetical protein
MSDRVPLSFLLASKVPEDPPVEPVVPFAAFRDEIPVIVTAVLERTAAIHAIGDRYDTGAIRLDRLQVDPTIIEWRATAGGSTSENGQTPWNRRKPKATAEDRQASRERSDRAALENQARNARVAAAEVVRDAALRSKELKDLSDRATPFNSTAKAQLAAGALHLVDAQAPAAHTEEEEANMQIFHRDRAAFKEELPAGTQRVDVTFTVPEKLKHCKRCGEDKPRDQFAATGIYGGYCATCEPLEKAERAAARDGKPKHEEAAHKTDAKVTRRAPKIASAPALAEPSVQPDSHARVLKLLEKRDALRVQLNVVIDELREIVAAG